MKLPMIDDLELMEIHVETLFTRDVEGRLRYVNEPGDTPAPRFFLGRTKEGNVWRFRYDLSEEEVEKLDGLASSEPIPTDLQENPINLADLENVLGTHSKVGKVWMGPAYRFPDDIVHPTNVVEITNKNRELLSFGFKDMVPNLELNGPCMAVVEDRKAVSLCCSARVSSQADEAGVETLEGYRGRGYAANVVAGWGMAVRDLDRIPLYSTSWDNLGSQRVTRKLGLILYGVDLHFT